jgi:(2Fe-2S) ferredoxin
MKTLDDLKKIREQAQQALTVREGEHSCKIVVAMGTCGIASGAREVMAAILDELEKRGITDVTVTQSGCKGLCDREPTVDVVKKGQAAVTYGLVTPEKARVIVGKHIINDEVQSEWVVAPQGCSAKS